MNDNSESSLEDPISSRVSSPLLDICCLYPLEKLRNGEILKTNLMSSGEKTLIT